VRKTWLLLLLVLVLALAGCGSDLAEGPGAQTTPAPAGTPLPDPGPATRGELEPGELGVVDFTGRAAARPATLTPNKDQILRRIEWSGWGGARATGRGTLEVLECEPTCAQGQTDRVPAVLTLSAPRTCGAQRYYGEATLRADGQAPAVFLRTPC